MVEQLEVERRWRVKHPLSIEAIEHIVSNAKDIEYISQSYMKSSTDKDTERVREVSHDFFGNNKTYWHTKKTLIETGVNREVENQISKEQYDKFLEKADPKKDPISKVRYTFDYNGQDFELDIFPKKKGMIILELELNSKDQKIELPPWLEITKEVTEEKHYSNYQLADKDWAEMGSVVQDSK
jgi:CYTH domain-containing protein